MPPTRHLRAAALAALLSLALTAPAGAVTANGRLQIIQLDVGQGDGALIISPLGQTVMIDDGVSGATPAMGVSVVNQLKALGVTQVDHHFASHYHSDHIGNIGLIAAAGITFGTGWDRGGSYSSGAYTTYVNTLGSKRRTLVKNQVITLDSLSAHPVRIKVVDLAGAGYSPTPTDENSLCLVLKVTYGEYDEVFGGDLTGHAESGTTAPDIESLVSAAVGPVEVYKVHHHGSRFSSNPSFLAATLPKIGVISCGNGNGYGHPTLGALTRLHNAGVHTYWTETGAGAAPLAGWDKVSNGQVVISATWEPGGVDTVRGNGFADTFTNSGAASDLTAPVATLSSPDGGETWKVGSTHALAWSATDNVGVASVDLDWSADDGVNWSAIASAIPNTGSYSWTVPAQATSLGRARVVARDAAGNLGTDMSLADFTVDWWTITAVAGAGGSITPSGVVNVSEGANRAFAIAPLAGCVISDVVADGASVGAVANWQFDAVAAYHTITASFLDVAPPVAAVTSPAGGESWGQGSLHDVTWSASDNLGVDSVTVEYSVAGVAGPWLTAARGLANSGTFAWTVPAENTDSARVRVIAYDHALNSAVAMSAGAFRMGSGTVDVPDAGPAVLALLRPSPNPASGPAQLRFSLPRAGSARVEILDLTGRRVWSAEAALPAGSHAWIWDGSRSDGSRAEAGLYFVRLATPWGSRVERLARLR